MSKLFSPLKLRDTELKNRIGVSPERRISLDDAGIWNEEQASRKKNY